MFSLSQEHDPEREVFKPPALLEKLVQRGALGAKSGAGFYRKMPTGAIHVLDPATLEHVPPPPLDPASLGPSARLPDTGERYLTPGG